MTGTSTGDQAFQGDQATGEGHLIAADGVGPLTQRDYVAVVEGTSCTPGEARERLLNRFAEFSPNSLAKFMRPDGEETPLKEEDELCVRILSQGLYPVVVTHVDEHSLTMRTREPHPEAGRISFGAAQDAEGRLVLHIRSRARINGPFRWLGYEVIGKHMQTRVWVTFLQRWAEACGGAVRGEVVLSTDQVEETPADQGEREHATFNTG